MEDFFDFHNKLSPLKEGTKKELNSIIKLKSIKKGEEIIKEGAYCRDIFFIQKGLVKFRFNSESGKEFIMRFFQEGQALTIIDSLIEKQPSLYEIIALEDTSYIAIPFLELEKRFQEHPELETFFRKLITKASINMMERVSEMLEEEAKNRYSNFLETNPTFFQRIKLGDISKYLGITQVSLSRIRASK